MGIRKRRLYFIFFIFFLICFKGAFAALSITPAKYEINFVSNLEQDFSFRTSSDDNEKKLRVYSSGELAKYVSFDKTEFIGGGEFIAKVKLPSNLSNYGRNLLIIGVEEIIDDEVSGIGTKVRVQAPIYIDVAYPGKYLEVFVRGEDVNVGENVDFELEIRNKGVENLTILPKLDIYSSSFIETLQFNERSLSSQESVKVQKSLITNSYLPGNYEARAVVSYGTGENDRESASTSFRIGSLFVRVNNHTSIVEINRKSVSKFNIEIENRWNNNIESVYAFCEFIDNNSQIMTSFKTTPINLKSWEMGNLEGYFDSSNFSSGDYYVNMTLFYHDMSSNKVGVVRFIEKKSNILLILGVLGIILLFILVLFALKFIFGKNEKKKSRKK